MRLAQAARKLTITTEEIVSFLKKQDSEIAKDSNAKLSPEQITLIFSRYGIPAEEEIATPAAEITSDIPEENVEQDVEIDEDKADTFTIKPAPNESVEEMPVDELVEGDEKEAEIEAENIIADHTHVNQSPVTEQSFEEKPDPKYKTVSDLLAEQEQQTEETEDASNEALAEPDKAEEVIIKAPKVTLQGLNVLGKIELPTPKPKEEKEKTDADIKVQRKARSQNVQRRKNKKELTPQQIRDRERRRLESKRKREKEALKASKEAFYKEQVLKPQQKQVKKKKKIKKTVITPKQPNRTVKNEVPKSVLGKFWRWLNT